MPRHWARITAALCALVVVGVSVAACSAPSGVAGPASQDSYAVIVTPANQTPTPAFPAFTVGAWPSTYSPGNTDNITIYVLCRVQDPTMKGPSTPPPAGLQVSINIGAPINQNYSGTTDAEGLAAIPVTLADPQSGQPVTVFVHASYKNASYNAETFFTPNPAATPTPTAGPNSTPGSATPTATP